MCVSILYWSLSFWLTSLRMMGSSFIHLIRTDSLRPGALQRNRVEREVGGGIGIGNTCKSMADSCQCMAKTTKKKLVFCVWLISLSIMFPRFICVVIYIRILSLFTAEYYSIVYVYTEFFNLFIC